jgi:hypothetical protein
VVLVLAGVIIVGSYRLDPARPLGSDRPLEVQVVSLDWKWLFIYPEQRVATVNELVIARTGPSRSVVPIDPDQPFQSIPISVWTVWRGVTAPVG